MEREWFLVDAKSEILGRLASKIAYMLMGKHKASYYPGMDSGDYIIIINSDKIRLTGNKCKQKIYYRHSGYMGGLKKTSREIIYHAVKGMLPKNRLGRKMIKKLKISQGADHIFLSQKPKSIAL